MLRDGDRYIELTFKVVRDGDQYAAMCQELDVASCGETIDSANESVLDAVDSHLQTLADIGDLHRFLKDRGVSVKTYSTPKRSLPSRKVKVSLGEWAQRSRIAVPH